MAHAVSYMASGVRCSWSIGARKCSTSVKHFSQINALSCHSHHRLRGNKVKNSHTRFVPGLRSQPYVPALHTAYLHGTNSPGSSAILSGCTTCALFTLKCECFPETHLSENGASTEAPRTFCLRLSCAKSFDITFRPLTGWTACIGTGVR
jgi:hypothetical protein